MSGLTDRCIRKTLGHHIVINPDRAPDEAHDYDRVSIGITGAGYDFSVGKFVYVVGEGARESENGIFEIPPRSTAIVLTLESLSVSKKITGSFHSKVSMASRGLGFGSTTLDPGWRGFLFVPVHNLNDKPLPLQIGQRFVTLMFRWTARKAFIDPPNEERHARLIETLEANKNKSLEMLGNVIPNLDLNKESELNRYLAEQYKQFADMQKKIASRKRLARLGQFFGGIAVLAFAWYLLAHGIEPAASYLKLSDELVAWWNARGASLLLAGSALLAGAGLILKSINPWR